MTTFTPDIAAQLRGPEWMRDRRAAALDRFDDVGLPTEAEEIWRYSRISQLDLDQYAPVDGDGERGMPSGADAGIAAVDRAFARRTQRIEPHRVGVRSRSWIRCPGQGCCST